MTPSPSLILIKKQTIAVLILVSAGSVRFVVRTGIALKAPSVSIPKQIPFLRMNFPMINFSCMNRGEDHFLPRWLLERISRLQSLFSILK
uniref:Uncharacterized protein n=1 Tax=mine drainage metagenome TaxID=410659 RepID=E6QRN0_9ZZZZ